MIFMLTDFKCQAKLKKLGHPWALGKAFHASSPFGNIFSLSGVDLQKLELSLEVNGQLRQSSTTDKMIFSVPELVAYLTTFFPLQPGDWILTGTPEGVGRLQAGDRVNAVVRGEGGKVLSEGEWKVTLSPLPANWRTAAK
jgi:fumarylpyruvate hydrolase